jgi:ABC-2 type transport system ATP-binding protein
MEEDMTRVAKVSPSRGASLSEVAALHQVSKRFGQTQALDRVSLSVERGELLALLGPNGAGKSTAIRLLSGLRRPDTGTVRLFGQNPQHASARVHLGVTPQETGLPDGLRVGEVVQLVRAHYPDPAGAGELLERFDLANLERRQCGGLSGGQRRRLAVALAFVGNPRLVILDEPTTGLDVEARRALWAAVKYYQTQGGTALLTTHYLEEAEALASRVVVINGGRIRAEGTVAEIKARVGLRQVRFQASAVPQIEGVSRLERNNGSFVLYTPNSDAVVRQLVEEQVNFSDLEVKAVSLEEAFVALTAE